MDKAPVIPQHKGSYLGLTLPVLLALGLLSDSGTHLLELGQVWLNSKARCPDRCLLKRWPQAAESEAFPNSQATSRDALNNTRQLLVRRKLDDLPRLRAPRASVSALSPISCITIVSQCPACHGRGR